MYNQMKTKYSHILKLNKNQIEVKIIFRLKKINSTYKTI